MERMQIWSTRGLAADRALTFWNEAISSAFLHVRTEPGGAHRNFQAQLQSLDLGSLSINQLHAQSYRVVCNTDDSRHDWVFLNLHQKGQCCLRQHGREQWAGPGTVSLNLGNSPFDFEFGDGVAMTCLRLPLSGAAARTGRLHDAAARPLPDGAGTRLLLGYVSHLLDNADTLQPWEAEQAANCLMDLLGLSLDSSPPPHADNRLGVREALFRRACAYLEAHLGDPELDLPRLCGHLQLAPRTLQTLFREQGTTFTHCLLEYRLQAADRLITSGSCSQLAQVAYAVGFADQSYFNRAFRRRFDMTPGERRLHQGVTAKRAT